jgi:iron complex outermembrane receptor protein
LPPLKGKQWEGGAKAEFFDKRLSVSTAFYDSYKTNIPTLDPTNPLKTLLIGLVESKGVKFDMTGKIDDNWSLIANYTHEDVHVFEGQPINPLKPVNTVFEQPQAGNWFPSVPANAGNLWVKYSAGGEFTGLNVMGGFNVVGRRWGDNANSFTIRGYTLVNAGLSYRFPLAGGQNHGASQRQQSAQHRLLRVRRRADQYHLQHAARHPRLAAPGVLSHAPPRLPLAAPLYRALDGGVPHH